MYSLDVNFLKDRKLDESSKVTTANRAATPISWRKQTPLFIGLGVGGALLGLTAILGTMLNLQKAKTQESIQQLEAEISQLNAQTQKVQEMEAKVKAIDEEATALVTVFNQIKPWSAILQEIRRLTPPNVQIIEIEETSLAVEGKPQPSIQLTIDGYARTYDDVNNFLLTLQNSEFFKAAKTKIEVAKKEEKPHIYLDEKTQANYDKRNIKVEFPRAIQYTIRTELSDIPASKLLPYLSRDGAVGLVTRIKTLEQKRSRSTMTFTEEYVPDDDQELGEEGNYPNAFGITFTPKVTGIAVALAGLLGSAFLAMNWVLPLNNEYQKLKADEQAKQDQVNQQKSGKLDEKFQTLELQLKQKEALKTQVLALFANEQNLDTILLDINQFFKSRNVELTSFEPDKEGIKIIEDGSLGSAVNKKLKRQSYNVEMKGAFEPTQSVIRDLERLQPLVLVRNVKSTLGEKEGDKKAYSSLILVDENNKDLESCPQTQSENDNENEVRRNYASHSRRAGQTSPSTPTSRTAKTRRNNNTREKVILWVDDKERFSILSQSLYSGVKGLTTQSKLKLINSV